jgi:hypothetical protein
MSAGQASRDSQSEPDRTVITVAREVLSQSFAVLLGAGASVEAGVPASYEMTEQIVKAINAGQTYQADHQAWALNFVCGALQAHSTAQRGSYLEGLDVEYVAAAVSLLAERDEHEATPFVSAWHPAIEEIDQSPSPPFFETTIKRALSSASSRLESMIASAARGKLNIRSGQLKGDFESHARQLAQEIKQLVDAKTGHGNGQVYSKLHRTMISELCRKANIDSAERVLYLLPLLRTVSRFGSMTIATVNYDRSVELACDELGLVFDTLIADWSATRAFPEVSDGVRLLKLHGSIDWAYDADIRTQAGRLPAIEVKQEEPFVRLERVPAIVFGRREKLKANGPFLDLLHDWEAQLRSVDALLVVGYSFRDDHINETIRRWINDSGNRHIVVVDPGWPDSLPDGFRGELRIHLAPPWPDGNGKLPPYHLHVIKEKTGVALGELFG